jgi:hypothetical protein
MSVIRMTDEQGKLLRADYFPLRLDARRPTTSGYFVANHRQKITQSRQKVSPIIKEANKMTSMLQTQSPSTYLVVDYHPQKQASFSASGTLNNQITSLPNSPNPQSPTRTSTGNRNGTASSSLLTRPTSSGEELRSSAKQRAAGSRVRHGAQPLRSSFILRQKLDLEADVSKQLYNKEDQVVQTEYNLNRLDFKGLNGYQKWTNEVAEPFIKDLRKALKTNRPENIEDYIISYCEEKKKGYRSTNFPPVTILASEEVKLTTDSTDGNQAPSNHRPFTGKKGFMGGSKGSGAKGNHSDDEFEVDLQAVSPDAAQQAGPDMVTTPPPLSYYFDTSAQPDDGAMHHDMGTSPFDGQPEYEEDYDG